MLKIKKSISFTTLLDKDNQYQRLSQKDYFLIKHKKA